MSQKLQRKTRKRGIIKIKDKENLSGVNEKETIRPMNTNYWIYLIKFARTHFATVRFDVNYTFVTNCRNLQNFDTVKV